MLSNKKCKIEYTRTLFRFHKHSMNADEVFEFAFLRVFRN